MSRLTLLGGFEVISAAGGVTLARTGQRLAALTALHRGVIGRQRAAETLWPHLEPPIAGASLRSTLSRLRAAAPGLLVAAPGSIRLAPEVSVDVWELEQRARSTGDGAHEAVTLDVLSADLLPDWEEDWVLFERHRLREIAMQLAEAQARHLASSRAFAPAVAMAYEVLRADPLRESAVRTLIEVYLAQGNHAQVIRAYEEFRIRTVEALGIEPSHALRALVASLNGASELYPAATSWNR